LLTLVDDPRDGSLDGACLFDGEGLTTYEKALVDRGRAKAALDDRETARRSGRAPNAQAVRARASDRPVPGVHSLVLRPGTISKEDLLGSAEGGLYVHELSGTHTVNEVTGELSLGAKGWRVTGRALGSPVEGVTVSGRLLDLLSGSLSLSRETRRLGAFLVPMILIGDVQVSS
jgi:PmbA protein